MENLFKVPVGDWSKDGHNQHTDYYVTANYPVEDMRQAYKDTCKKIGLQLNHSTNYTGIEGATRRYEKTGEEWRVLLAEYGECAIDERAYRILLEHGFDFERIDGMRDENDQIVPDDEEGVFFCEEGVFDLFMWFVAYSMPKDFEYKEFKLKAEPIIGWWCNGLNHQIGYGVFN